MNKNILKINRALILALSIRVLTISTISVLALSFSQRVLADENILQELVGAAQKHDDQLLIAKAQFEAAKGQAAQALAPVLPQIRASSQQSQNAYPNGEQPDATTTTSRVEFSQTLYEPAKYRAYSAAKARAEQFGYRYGAAQSSLFTRLLGQYLDILTEEDNLRTVRAQRDRLNEQLKVVRARVSSGTRSAVDLAEITASAALSESQYELSRITLRSFYEGLSASINFEIKNLPPIRKNLKLQPLENDDPAYWLEIALEKNLALLAAKAEVKAAKEDVKISNRGHIPTFDLFATYSQTETSASSAFTPTESTVVGVRFNVPIYIGGQVFSGVKVAKARLDEAQRRLHLTEVELRTVLPSVVRRIKQGEHFIDASKGALDARAAVVAQTEVRYSIGAADITDLLLSYERLYDSERSYYSSLYSHIKNYAEFYVRIGGLDEDVLNRLYSIGDFENFDPNTPVY